MKRFAPILAVVATPALGGEISPLELRAPQQTANEVLRQARTIKPGEIRMIDASKLTLEELMELARAERNDPTRLQCCDWGGGTCIDHDPQS